MPNEHLPLKQYAALGIIEHRVHRRARVHFSATNAISNKNGNKSNVENTLVDMLLLFVFISVSFTKNQKKELIFVK